MSSPKTSPTSLDPIAFLDAVADDRKRAEAFVLMEMMRKVTGEPPVMWGPSIVGFGSYRHKYKSGREGKWMLCAFSPRKTAFTVYIMSGFESLSEHLGKLGKHKVGKGCLYFNRLSDIDLEVLETMVRDSVSEIKRKRA